MSVQAIVEEFRELSFEERKQLLKLLVDSFVESDTGKTHSILEFEGVAAHLADGEDPQAYLNRLRDEWDSSDEN